MFEFAPYELAKLYILSIPIAGTITAMVVAKLERPYNEKLHAQGLTRSKTATIDYYFMVAMFWPLWLIGHALTGLFVLFANRK